MMSASELQFRELKDMIVQQSQTIREQNATIESLRKSLAERDEKESLLQEQISYLTKKLFGTSSEKRSAQVEGQMNLFDEAETEADPSVPDETVDVKPHKRKTKTTNKDKLASLPVKEILLELPEDTLLCEQCGRPLERVGKEFAREELQFIPAQMVRLQYYTVTYRCRDCCEGGSERGFFVKSVAPEPLMKHSLASPSSVAWTMYQKYANAMPLYRQEKDWKTQYGIELKRATLANWIIYCSEHYLKPLYEYLHKEMLKRKFLMADETRVQVLKEPDRKAQTDSYMWLYRTGEDEGPAIILYQYTQTRARSNAEAFLKGFEGYLETDGYQGYESLPGIRRCCCWAHVRRYFCDAVPSGRETDLSEPAVQGVMYCDQLFMHEKTSKQKGHSPEERKAFRLEKEKPVIDAFFSWLGTQRPAKGSRMDKAVQYATNRREYLMTYLEDGRCSLSNNLAENAIRPFTVGRKNWLFSDSQKGAQASAICYTMVEMAKAHDLNVLQYLNYLLLNRPEADATEEALARLMPWHPDVAAACKCKNRT